MNTSSFLEKVANLGIQVQHGSSNRAWAKAAFLFIEHYVLPAIPEKFLPDESSFVENITLQLLNHLVQHYCKQIALEKSNTISDVNLLPTRKCFISIKKLVERYIKDPVCSYTDLKAYGKNQSAPCLCDWTNVPGILVGIIKPDEKYEKLVFCDRTGSTFVLIVEPHLNFINTVSFLLAWKYIPGGHSCERYIEVLEQPIVLHNFVLKTEATFVANSLSFDIVNLQTDDSMEQNYFDISGYLYSIQQDMQKRPLIHIVVKKSYELDCDLTAGCLVYPVDKISILLDGKYDWLPCFSYDDFVTITQLRTISSENKGIGTVVTTTPSSRLTVSTDAKCLVQQYEQGCFETSLSQTFGNESLHGGVCRIYVGRISSVESETLRVFTLNSCSVMIILTGVTNFALLGFRIGALISIKTAHICKIGCRIALLCCKSSVVKVIEHSDQPTPSCFRYYSREKEDFMEKIRPFCLHPSTICSIVELSRKLTHLLAAARRDDATAESIMKQTWLFKALFPVNPSPNLTNADSIFKTESSSCCDVELSLQKAHLPFVHFSLRMIRDVSLNLAKAHFRHDQSSQDCDWNCVELQCDELKQNDYFNHEWTNSLVCVAKLSSSDGCFELWDGYDAIKCLVLPRQVNKWDGTSLNHEGKLEKNRPILCTKDKGCLVRIVNFRVIVEIKSVPNQCTSSSSSSLPGDSSSSFEFPDPSIELFVYVVVCKEDIVLLKSRDSSQNTLGCSDGLFTQEVQLEKEVAKASLLDTLMVDKPVHHDSNHLLFIVHKGPLQSFPGKKYAFHITVLRCNKTMKLQECHFELTGRASQWYPFLHATMIVQMIIEFDREKNSECQSSIPNLNLANCSLEHCHFVHVHNFNDIISPFSNVQVESFYHHSYKMWKANHFSRGIDQIYSVADLVACPPSSQSQLVAVRGEVNERMELNSDALTGTEQRYLRIALAGSTNYQLYVYIQIRENCSLVLLGIVPGAMVDFYRVKLVLSPEGEVYCKYTATSFHCVRSIKVTTSQDGLNVSRKSQTSIPGDQDVVTSSLNLSVDDAADSNNLDVIGHKNLLYNLYMKRWSDCPYKVTRLKISMTRLLHVELSYVRSTIAQASAFQPFRETNVLEGGEYRGSSKSFTQKMESNVVFSAKSIISDGSGRGILYFGSTNQMDFCKLAEIEREEWNDIIDLLRHSTCGSISYDCDLHDGKDLLRQNQIVSDRFAQQVAVSLFNDINSRVLTSREILVRRRLSSRERPWKNSYGVDSVLADGLRPDSMFKIGTVPIENHGNSSLKSVAIRLLQFNCLSTL